MTDYRLYDYPKKTRRRTASKLIATEDRLRVEAESRFDEVTRERELRRLILKGIMLGTLATLIVCLVV